MSADRYVASAGASDPGSWNRYAYVRNDPVGRVDDGGTCDTSADGAYSITVCGGAPDTFDPSTEIIPQYIPMDGSRGNGIATFLSDPGAVGAAVLNTAKRLAAAVGAALSALSNPKCAGLFNLDPNAPGPAALLASIASGEDPQAYFTEEFIGPDPNNPNAVVNAETMPTSYSLQNGQITSTGVANKVVVAFNFWPGAPFNTGTPTADAITVLHELGHLEELLYGMGSTLLVNDSVEAQGSIAASNAASAFNTKLVQANCSPGSH
jgi:hypothetical protein